MKKVQDVEKARKQIHDLLQELSKTKVLKKRKQIFAKIEKLANGIQEFEIKTIKKILSNLEEDFSEVGFDVDRRNFETRFLSADQEEDESVPDLISRLKSQGFGTVDFSEDDLLLGVDERLIFPFPFIDGRIVVLIFRQSNSAIFFPVYKNKTIN